MIAHKRSYVHGNARLTVSMETLGDKTENGILASQDLTVQYDDKEKIYMWNICKICGQITPPVQMSEQTWNYSTGKFIEYSLYNLLPVSKICSHKVHSDHIRCFSLQDLVIKIEYNPVNILEILVPVMKISWSEQSKIEMRILDLEDVTKSIEQFYGSVFLWIKNFDFTLVVPDKIESIKGRLLGALKKLNSEMSFLMEQLETVVKENPITDSLCLNIVLQSLHQFSLNWKFFHQQIIRVYMTPNEKIEKTSSQTSSQVSLQLNSGSNLTLTNISPAGSRKGSPILTKSINKVRRMPKIAALGDAFPIDQMQATSSTWKTPQPNSQGFPILGISPKSREFNEIKENFNLKEEEGEEGEEIGVEEKIVEKEEEQEQEKKEKKVEKKVQEDNQGQDQNQENLEREEKGMFEEIFSREELEFELKFEFKREDLLLNKFTNDREGIPPLIFSSLENIDPSKQPKIHEVPLLSTSPTHTPPTFLSSTYETEILSSKPSSLIGWDPSELQIINSSYTASGALSSHTSPNQTIQQQQQNQQSQVNLAPLLKKTLHSSNRTSSTSHNPTHESISNQTSHRHQNSSSNPNSTTNLITNTGETASSSTTNQGSVIRSFSEDYLHTKERKGHRRNTSVASFSHTKELSFQDEEEIEEEEIEPQIEKQIDLTDEREWWGHEASVKEHSSFLNRLDSDEELEIQDEETEELGGEEEEFDEDLFQPDGSLVLGENENGQFEENQKAPTFVVSFDSTTADGTPKALPFNKENQTKDEKKLQKKHATNPLAFLNFLNTSSNEQPFVLPL